MTAVADCEAGAKGRGAVTFDGISLRPLSMISPADSVPPVAAPGTPPRAASYSPPPPSMTSLAPPVPDTAVVTPAAPRRRLLRVLGVTFGLAVTIGNTIGAGILRTPGSVAEQLPSTGWYLAVWIAGGLYALLGAVSLAELGTMLPRSGGLYVFARHALGRYAGFLVGWVDWAATCGSVAAVSVLIGGVRGRAGAGAAGAHGARGHGR